jgi:RNA polymerase sigma factor (sigma-70 family)
LRPDQRVTPAQDALLSGIARRARVGDMHAHDLLWRAFAPKLEPAVVRCGRCAWQRGWVRRDGRPWELDDLRQEAWLVFADLTASWSGSGSFTQYVIGRFSWRLRNAMRRLGPPRRTSAPPARMRPGTEYQALLDAETEAVLARVTVALCPADGEVLRRRVTEGMSFGQIARQLGVSRRTIARRWRRIRLVSCAVLSESPPAGHETAAT